MLGCHNPWIDRRSVQTLGPPCFKYKFGDSLFRYNLNSKHKIKMLALKKIFDAILEHFSWFWLGFRHFRVQKLIFFVNINSSLICRADNFLSVTLVVSPLPYSQTTNGCPICWCSVITSTCGFCALKTGSLIRILNENLEFRYDVDGFGVKKKDFVRIFFLQQMA